MAAKDCAPAEDVICEAVPAIVKVVACAAYAAEVFSASVQASVQFTTAPEASTPRGNEPAEQSAPSAAKAVAVEALPVNAPMIVGVDTCPLKYPFPATESC